MGLPIWRDPEEKKPGKHASKPDSTACLRSSIRRRPSVHGRRSTRARSTRDPPSLPPRFERSPPPSVGFNGLRDARRGESRRVPPISTLLESADLNSPLSPPPPPVPESRNYFRTGHDAERANNLTHQQRILSMQARERRLRQDLAELQARAARLEQVGQTLHSLPGLPSARVAASRLVDATLRSPFGTSPTTARSRYSWGASTEDMQELTSSDTHAADDRPDSRDGRVTRRSPLPTPPLEISRFEDGPIMPGVTYIQPTDRPSHPLSNSWRPDSPINGLGDRMRSPTPGDGWEVIRTTITPDATLPSAESSFTSAVASQSFSAGNTTQTTSSSEERSQSSSEDRESDSASSVDPDDLACTEDESPRVAYVRRNDRQTDAEREGELVQQPERYDEEGRLAVWEASEQVHGYFQRFTADALQPRSASPPPNYEALRSHPDAIVFTSRDEPVPHPVSPPTPRNVREVEEHLLNGNVNLADLEPVRRVVERLAARDDVPEDWWVSMGLNISRTQPRERSSQSARRNLPWQHSPPRSDVIERNGSRL